MLSPNRLAASFFSASLLLFGTNPPPGSDPAAADARGLRLGHAAPQSLGALAFGPDGTLFAADSRGATLYAFDAADAGKAAFGDRTLVRDLDRRVATLLGTTVDKIRFNDMAVHPVSGNVYFSVARIDGDASQAALIRARGSEQIELVDLDRIKFATTAVPEAPSRDAKTPWGQPQWTLTVTDLAFVDGQVVVAGLSNEQFASALRRIPFPFKGTGGVSTVEIYHTSHNKWETAAPIEAFLPIDIGGVPMVIAGYGCSPIATFKRSDLASAKHLKGRTVAELGGGNRPIDMISYQRDGKEWILVANSHRTLMRLDPAEIAKAPEMTKPVSQAYEPGGVGYLPIASAGVMQIDNLDANQIAILERDIETGSVSLIAMSKKWL